MPVRMTGAGPAIDDQAAGLQFGGQPHRLEGVVDAFAERASVAAGKTAGPQQVGYFQAAFGQQFNALIFAEVGELLPPDADGPDAGRP